MRLVTVATCQIRLGPVGIGHRSLAHFIRDAATMTLAIDVALALAAKFRQLRPGAWISHEHHPARQGRRFLN